MEKLKVGIIGATGMVGQRFVTLLENHPWFEVKTLAASPRSKWKTFEEAVGNRWRIENKMPETLKSIIVKNANEIENVIKDIDFIFSAIDLKDEEIKELENWYAKAWIPIISNNSAHRWTKDVPMIIPEVNSSHLDLIEIQKEIHEFTTGFIVTKPNCSIQSYVPVLDALKEFTPQKVIVTTMQAISWSWKTLNLCEEIQDNVIPLRGEEIKSEKEPLKIFGDLKDGEIINSDKLKISAQCNRVAVNDWHMVSLNIGFKNNPTKQQIINALSNYNSVPQDLKLPSAPNPCITFIDSDERPQTKLDRNTEKWMWLTVWSLIECNILDWKMKALSHNTIRWAAGGAILTAELLYKKWYLKKIKN